MEFVSSIPADDDTYFDGEIVVASRIVDALSSGLYESPAACLKELVNNAYDADATNVGIYVKPDADEIIIDDDGTGLSQQEFVRHFSRISESHKRDEGDVTAGKHRKKVGKIGIGFIAANELCDVMEIESTKEGSTELLRVEIDFQVMRGETIDERRVDDDREALRKGDFRGYRETVGKDEHYTRIYLRNVRGDARRILVSDERQSLEGRAGSLYGLNADSVERRLRPPRLKSWSDLDQYSQTYLGVALNVPVRYPDLWLPEREVAQVTDFVTEVDELGFNVTYDGTEMRKPVVFAEDADCLLRRWEFTGEHVAARAYFFANHGSLRPRELQGVLLRVRNAAVGEYDGSFLNYPIAESQLFKNWVSGEIWADDRLEEAMNIDRRTLRVTHPAYVELQQAFHHWFVGFLAEVRRELYSKRRDKKKVSVAHDEASRIDRALRATSVSAPIAQTVREAWPEPESPRDNRASRRLNRKYTVGEVYEIVLDVAAEHMTEKDFNRFVAELTRRLGE